jgi:hypothetical protein
VGQLLVDDIEDPHKITTFAAMRTLDTATPRVDETQDYPEIGAGVDKYTIGSLPNGRRLSITGEAIEQNNLADITRRVDALVKISSDLVEEQTLARVTDLNGSTASAAEPYALHLNNTATTLYSATANQPTTQCPSGTQVNNNALVDTTDLENARAVLANMRDSRLKRIAIPISDTVLLVPDALLMTAFKIINSADEPGVLNEVNAYGPRGIFRPQIVSSPKLDDLSTTAWYLGAFRRQFTRKWSLRFEYVTLGMDTESFLKSRVAFQARIAWSVEIGAVEHNMVVRNLTGTTAPVPA